MFTDTKTTLTMLLLTLTIIGTFPVSAVDFEYVFAY